MTASSCGPRLTDRSDQAPPRKAATSHRGQPARIAAVLTTAGPALQARAWLVSLPCRPPFIRDELPACRWASSGCSASSVLADASLGFARVSRRHPVRAIAAAGRRPIPFGLARTRAMLGAAKPLTPGIKQGGRGQQAGPPWAARPGDRLRDLRQGAARDADRHHAGALAAGCSAHAAGPRPSASPALSACPPFPRRCGNHLVRVITVHLGRRKAGIKKLRQTSRQGRSMR
jgi:hypothetical protein